MQSITTNGKRELMLFSFLSQKHLNTKEPAPSFYEATKKILPSSTRDGFGPGPAQPKLARAYTPTWPKVGPGPKVAQRTLAQIGLGPIFFGPGPAQEIDGPNKWS